MNFTPKSILKILTVVLLSTLFVACGAKKTKEVNIVIPGPPDEPRYFYIGDYEGANTFNKSTALDIFIGKESAMAAGKLFKPYGVVAFNNKMYVADTAVGVVFTFDLINKKVSMLGDKSKGRLMAPAGVAYDSRGNIYVSDTKLKKVYGYDSSGKLIFAVGKKREFKRPVGMAVNSRLNRLYVVDAKDHNVKVYSLSGKPLFKFGKRGLKKDGEFNFPTNVAINPRNGNVLVVDTQNFRVQIFDKDGKFLRKFGKIGDFAGAFARPKGISLDSEGNIYVADAAFNLVQVFNDKGELLLYFGGHWDGANPGAFMQMSGLNIDEKDRIYIVDGMRGAVQVYQYVSKKWKKSYPEEYKKLKKGIVPKHLYQQK